MRTQLTRGSHAANTGFIGPEGGLSVDLDDKRLRLHDGVTQGGFAFDGGLGLQGTTEVGQGNQVNFTLSPYNPLLDYQVSAVNGSLTRNGATLTYDAPSGGLDDELHVNVNNQTYRFLVTLTSPSIVGTITDLSIGPSARNAHAAATEGGKFYIFGGHDGSYLNDLWEYDPNTDTWTQLTSGAGIRNYSAMTALNGKLYVFAGNGPSASDDLWEYDIAADTWTQLTSGATARSSHTLTAVSGKLYVFGGNEGGNLSDLWVYDPVGISWQQLASVPAARRDHAAAELNGKLYIHGGVGTPTLWEYDPQTDVWATLTSSPQWVIKHGMSAAFGKLYVVGGYIPHETSDILWEYDPQVDTWTVLPTGYIRERHTTVTISDQLYVFGGNDGTSNVNTLFRID